MRRARSATFVLLASTFAVAGACSQSTAPLGAGDDYINDTDGEDQTTPQQGDDGGVDDVFARVDSGYAPPPDGYAPYSWCSQCACPADTYCFGGGTNITSFSGTCSDAGATPGPLAIGCQPIPSACANEPSCECILAAVQADLSCAPVCSITNMIVYCPNP
jgi:hypothetical protein